LRRIYIKYIEYTYKYKQNLFNLQTHKRYSNWRAANWCSHYRRIFGILPKLEDHQTTCLLVLSNTWLLGYVDVLIVMMIWYDVIWYMRWYYMMIWYDMIDMIWWYGMIWYDMIWLIYDIWWYDIIRYDIRLIWYIWYDMVWYDTI
jgi:hypothetical protein